LDFLQEKSTFQQALHPQRAKQDKTLCITIQICWNSRSETVSLVKKGIA
jgi:hypothetical protein